VCLPLLPGNDLRRSHRLAILRATIPFIVHGFEDFAHPLFAGPGARGRDDFQEVNRFHAAGKSVMEFDKWDCPEHVSGLVHFVQGGVDFIFSVLTGR